jgi:hypothetical protein
LVAKAKRKAKDEAKGGVKGSGRGVALLGVVGEEVGLLAEPGSSCGA